MDKKRTGLQRESRARFALENVFKKTHGWSTFGRWCRQNAHETVARVRFHIKFAKRNFHVRREQRGSVDAARFLVDLAQRFCYAGCQLPMALEVGGPVSSHVASPEVVSGVENMFTSSHHLASS